MEKIFNLNLKAHENIIIAKKEKLVALELKNLANNLLKKVKSRKKFVEKEIKLAQIRKQLIEKNEKLLQNRIKSKELLKFPEEVINNERDFINYHERVAENQLELAEHHEEIAKVEEKLAKHKLILANSKKHLANVRIKLGKLQLKYIKMIQKNSHKKALILKSLYKRKQVDLNHHLRDVKEKEKEVKELQDTIAILTTKFSQILVK
ncbi:MAG: hypothetical protein ACFFCE_14720 [Promethearchaeota archaeon]